MEAPLCRPRVTTKRGAGSVSWRVQLWRPNELVRPRLASFSQPRAELAASGCRSLYRGFGHQYLRRSVASLSEITYASGFRSWCTFGGLTAQDRYLRPCESEEAKVWALIDFVAWCCASPDNQAGSPSSKLAAIRYIHRVDVGIELSIRSPLIKRVLQGISRSHTLAGTRSRVRLHISRDMLINGRQLISSWGFGGKVLWLCLGMSYFFFARSDEVFANVSGVVNPARCLTRSDVAFFFERQTVEASSTE